MKPAGRPLVLGLTGSIGMGKSATAAMFAKRGIPVHDSDAAVHALYGPGGGAGPGIAQIAPDAVGQDGAIDRAILRAAVLGDPARMAALEAVVHPLVQAESRAFLARHADAPLVVLDIPLLYESGAETRCDAVLVVTADPEVQRARVLSRPRMTEAAFTAILARQMPDAAKRSRADYLIDTGLGFDNAEGEVDALLSALGHPSLTPAVR